MIFEYNTTNHPSLSSDNFEEDISLRASNNNKKEISLADIMGNDNESSKLADINQ